MVAVVEQVVVIALFTGFIFFVVTYGSSCREVPDYLRKLTEDFAGNERTDGLSPRDFDRLIKEANDEVGKYPKLFCSEDNEYSEYGQV